MLLSNRSSQYQNQYSLVNKDGWLRLGPPRRHILTMPPELLIEIFFFCLPFDEDLIVVPDPDDPPLVLCAVCRQWRTIALTTPKLWSSIYFDCHFWTPHSTLYLDFCNEWLGRAENTPLSLQLYADSRASEIAVYFLLEIVGAVSQQWQNILLGGQLPFRLFPELFPRNGKYPLLETLSISPPPIDLPRLSFCGAPRLRDVFISESTYRTEIKLPFHQLTKFGTLGIDLEPCLQLLHRASNLVEAHLRISPYDASALPNTIFSLPQLRSLNLGGTRMGILPMTLLKCLKAPALKTLALGFEDAQARDLTDISPFLSFVSQSAFQLQTLTLSCLPVTTDELIECLKASPSVIHLKLQICPGTIDMNPVFAAFTGHRDFLPNLGSLGLAFSTWQPTAAAPIVDASVVVDMLIWRCLTSTATRLRSFLYESWDCDETVQSYIKAHAVYPELEALGMNLDLDLETEVSPFVDVLP